MNTNPIGYSHYNNLHSSLGEYNSLYTPKKTEEKAYGIGMTLLTQARAKISSFKNLVIAYTPNRIKNSFSYLNEKSTQVYGLSKGKISQLLAYVCRTINPNSSKNIQRSVKQLMDHFEKDESHFQEEGVFRTSGSTSKVKELIKGIKKSPSFVIDPQKYDTAELTVALKSLIGEAKIFEGQEAKLAEIAIQINDNDLGFSFCSSFKSVIDQLPSHKKEILSQFISILSKVVSFSNDNENGNKMDAKNLSKVTGPRLLPADDLNRATTNNLIVQKLIENYDALLKQ